MAGIIRKSLVDQIYEELRMEIINQNIGFGERLNVNELQEKFDISCTPIREAINRLQKEGLVKYKNNVGASVIDIEEKDIIEIQQVAMTLDCASIRYSMGNRKNELIAQELLIYIEAYKKTNDEVTRAHCIEEFNEVFYKYAYNSRLIDVAKPIKAQQSMLRTTYAKEKKNESNMEEHIKIYNAVLLGDIDSAIKAMEENYKKGTELLLQVICNED